MPPALLLSLALFAAAGAPHPDSISSSRIVVSGAEARLDLRCQVISFLEVIDGLDADADGTVSAAEVELQREAIQSYVMEHYVLVTGSDRSFQGGRRLEPYPVSIGHLEETGEQGRGWRGGAIDVGLTFRSGEALRDLQLEVSLFQETSPFHIELAQVIWEDGVTATFSIDASNPIARTDPTGRGAFRAFFGMGWHHILVGWDHLAFLAALVLASRRLGSLLAVVTAFTLSHSITLGLASLGVIDLSRHIDFIEAVIALSIAYVAVDSLAHSTLKRSRWPEAFAFGLVHGLGFASVLSGTLVQESSKAWALFSFNIGVEAGQVVVVLALALLLRFSPGAHDEPEPYLAPRRVRIAGLVAVAALGLFWFFQRL